MRDVILYSAASLDSFIARKNGSVDWLEAPDLSPGDEDFGYRKFYASIDTTLMGHNTYKQAGRMGRHFPFRKMANYVFSRTLNHRWPNNTIPVNGNITEFVRKLKRRKGKNIWLVGGPEINTVLLNHDLINRIILTIVPVVLGVGIPLFGEEAKPRRFRLVRQKSYENGFIQLTWEKRRR